MAGATNSNPINPMTVEKVDEPDSMKDKKRDYWYGQIFDRASLREAELDESDRAPFLKFLKALEEAFGKQFDYKDILGAKIDTVRYGQRVYNYNIEDTYKNIDEKAPLLDVLYTAYEHIKIKEIGEGDKKQTVFVGNSGNGHIVANRNKIEFVPADEIKKDGTKGKKKPFELQDAYDLILLAVHDRSMTSPNKMKFSGSPREQAMLYYAATQINTLLPASYQIDLTDTKEPKRLLGLGPKFDFASKDKIFGDIIADIKDNDAQIGTILKEKADEEKAKATAQEADKQKNQSKPDNNGPDGSTPPENTPPTNDGGPDSSGNNENTADQDQDQDVPDDGSVFGERFEQDGNPSVQTTNAKAEPGPDNVATNELDSESGFTAADKTALSQDAEPETVEQAPQNNDVEEQPKNHADLMALRAVDLATRLEGTLRGQSAIETITAIVQSYEFEQNLPHDPANVQRVLNQLANDKLVVSDAVTGESIFRGVPTFKDRNLLPSEQSDYQAIYTAILKTPEKIIGMTERDLAAAVKTSIDHDGFLETRGLNLGEMQRLDMANGMAKRIFQYLQEDNIVQLNEQGKVNFVARLSAPMKQHFEQAAAQPATAPAPAPVPQNANRQAFTSMYLPVRTSYGAYTTEGFAKATPSTPPAETPKHKATVEGAVAEPITRKANPPRVRIPGSISDKDAMNAIETGSGRAAPISTSEAFDKLNRIAAQLDNREKTTSDEAFAEFDRLLDEPDTKAKKDLDVPDIDAMFERISDAVQKDMSGQREALTHKTPESIGFKHVSKTVPVSRADFRQASNLAVATANGTSEEYSVDSLVAKLEDMMAGASQEALNGALERAEQRGKNTAIQILADRARRAVDRRQQNANLPQPRAAAE